METGLRGIGLGEIEEGPAGRAAFGQRKGEAIRMGIPVKTRREHQTDMVTPHRLREAYNTAMSAARRVMLGVGLGLCALAQWPVPQQRPRPAQPELPGARLRVDTQLVLVPVAVNDKLNRPVSGLERENFRVFEDNAQHPVVQFPMADEPL